MLCVHLLYDVFYSACKLIKNVTQEEAAFQAVKEHINTQAVLALAESDSVCTCIWNINIEYKH